MCGPPLYLNLIIVPIRFARLLVGVSKSPLVMDSLVQTVLSGNIFIQTQSFQKVIELCSGSGSNQVCSACCLVRSSMNQYWKAAAPEPVYGQRQCRVGRVLGDQRCDTPDQSAARSTTLGHLLSKGVTKGKGGSRKTAQQTKERGE